MAAMQGEYWTISKVGRMYYHGEGVFQDYRLAHGLHWRLQGNEQSMILNGDIKASFREDTLNAAETAVEQLRAVIPVAIVRE